MESLKNAPLITVFNLRQHIIEAILYREFINLYSGKKSSISSG